MDATTEFAAKVANDVSENIDCRETRAQLREVIRFFSMAHCKASAEARLAETRGTVLEVAVRLLLPHAKSKRAKPARRIAKLALKS